MSIHVNLYWLYDLPNWLFGVVVVLFFALYGLVGLFLTRKWVRRQHQVDHSHNDVVSYYLAAITVFYGITLVETEAEDKGLTHCGLLERSSMTQATFLLLRLHGISV